MNGARVRRSCRCVSRSLSCRLLGGTVSEGGDRISLGYTVTHDGEEPFGLLEAGCRCRANSEPLRRTVLFPLRPTLLYPTQDHWGWCQAGSWLPETSSTDSAAKRGDPRGDAGMAVDVSVQAVADKAQIGPHGRHGGHRHQVQAGPAIRRRGRPDRRSTPERPRTQSQIWAFPCRAPGRQCISGIPGAQTPDARTARM